MPFVSFSLSQMMLLKAWSVTTTSSCSRRSPTYRWHYFYVTIWSISYSIFNSSLVICCLSNCSLRRISMFSSPPPTMKIRTSENKSRSITSQRMKTLELAVHLRGRLCLLQFWPMIQMGRPRPSPRKLVCAGSGGSCSAPNRSSGLTWACELWEWGRWKRPSRSSGWHVCRFSCGCLSSRLKLSPIPRKLQH